MKDSTKRKPCERQSCETLEPNFIAITDFLQKKSTHEKPAIKFAQGGVNGRHKTKTSNKTRVGRLCKCKLRLLDVSSILKLTRKLKTVNVLRTSLFNESYDSGKYVML